MRSDWGWSIFTFLFWIVVLAALIFVVLRLLRHHEGLGHQKVDPIDIAKERYAKGDITREQFEELKKDLSK